MRWHFVEGLALEAGYEEDETDDQKPSVYASANPTLALRLQSVRLASRVAGPLIHFGPHAPMKKKLIVLASGFIAILWAVSVQLAYQRGYRHGGNDERACRALDPATTEALIRGEITARRDTKKHPFLKGRIDQRSDRTVNSFPVPYSPR